MTPEQQNIAIAQVCGWKRSEKWDYSLYGRVSKNPSQKVFNRVPAYEKDECTRRPEELPNYTGSLDDMHEAEKSLDVDQEGKYGDALIHQYVHLPENIVCGDKPTKRFPLNCWGYFTLAHLTAAQKAETFLKVLGLWEETLP